MVAKSFTRKEQIISSAQQMFRKKGFGASSMRELAKEVGVEPSSLYSHFKSKDEILKIICFHIADEFFEALDPIQNSVSSPTEKLKRVVTEHTNVIMKNLDAATVFFLEWKHLKEPALFEFKAMRNRYEDGFRQIVQEGITLCEFKNMDIDFTVRLIFSVLNGVHEWYRKSGTVSPDEVGDKLSHFILEGLSVE